MSSHTASGTISLGGTAPYLTGWVKPFYYHEADGGISLSGVYAYTQLAAGGPSLAGVALARPSYSYQPAPRIVIGGTAHCKLVTPTRPRYRAVPLDPPVSQRPLSGHCLVYSEQSARAKDRSPVAAAWLSKSALLGRTVLYVKDVGDPAAIPDGAVVAEVC